MPKTSAEQEMVANLTERQRNVAILLGQGHTYSEVADLLSISRHTVHEHLRHINERTGCARRGELALLLVRMGLLK